MAGMGSHQTAAVRPALLPQRPTPAPVPKPTPAPTASAMAMPEGTADLPPGMMVGEYQIEGKLGEGGMGAVYSARHPLIGKKAAIKVISAALCTDSSAVERFVQEAASVNRISHPNIVDVFAFGQLPDARAYFVMEWLQGETLSERMARGQLSLAEAIEILDQVCDALEAAHEKGIVHRDLKPDNTYLMAVRGNRQLVKLLDFGIAKLAGEGDVRVQKTRTGMMMGTPGYISPEQARGKAVDHRTDIYALGAMMFEMVLGRLPFEADNAMDIVLKHLTEQAPAPSGLWPDIPPSLDSVISRMLDKDANGRPTLHEIRAVLNELRGVAMQMLGHVGGVQQFKSGFAPRLNTPPIGTPIRPTPPPGTLSAPAGKGTEPPRRKIVTDSGATGEGATGFLPVPTTPDVDAPVAFAAPAPKSSKKLAMILGGVGLVAAIAVVAVVVGGGKSDTPAPAPVVVAKNEPPPKPVDPPPKQPDPTGAGKVPVTPTPAPGTLAVMVNVANARIELDGKVITESGDSAIISIDDEKEHELTITAPKHKPDTRKVSVASGKTVPVTVMLEPEKKGVVGVKKPPTGDGKKPPTGNGPIGDGTIDPFAPVKKK